MTTIASFFTRALGDSRMGRERLSFGQSGPEAGVDDQRKKIIGEQSSAGNAQLVSGCAAKCAGRSACPKTYVVKLVGSVDQLVPQRYSGVLLIVQKTWRLLARIALQFIMRSRPVRRPSATHATGCAE